MPAFNVAEHLPRAVRSVPDFVDHVIVIDDGSTDNTADALATIRRPNLVRLKHPVNRGVGAAIATGYATALRLECQAVAVMAGDGQMDPADLRGVLDPVVSDQADYAKGNRFLHHDIWRAMPASRLAGNVVLSLLTKLTSGYWRLFDSQCGYTVISRRALLAIQGRLFARYGYPNDVLARLRTVRARVVDVPVRPVYEGQPSGIRWWTVVYPVLFVLCRSLARRIWQQHIRRHLLPGSPPDSLPPVSDADRPADHLLPAPPP